MTKKVAVFYGYKIHWIYKYMLYAGMLFAAALTAWEYNNGLNDNKVFIFNFFIVPTGITLCLGVLMVFLKMLYEFLGYGELPQIPYLVIVKQMNLKLILQIVFLALGAVLMPLVGYVIVKIMIGTNLKLISTLKNL